MMSAEILMTLSDAMLAWTGWKSEISPRRDDEAFIARYGAESAKKWLPVLHALENEFYASNARYTSENLQEMLEAASEDFKKKHPQIEDAVVQALAWCYTFDYK
jgi:hypothetical protein